MKPGFLLATIFAIGGVSHSAHAQSTLGAAMVAYAHCLRVLAERTDDHHSDVETIVSRIEDGCSAELKEKVDGEVAQSSAFASVRDQVEQDNLNERHHAARMAVLFERAERH